MNQAEVMRRQAGALADILTGIILLAVGRLTGDNGTAYVVAAYEIFLLVWLPVGGGLTDALGRLLRNRNNKGQYKNAAKMRSSAMLLQLVLGAAGSLLLLAVAQPVTEKAFGARYSGMILMALSPAVFLRGVSKVLAGYFQGEGSELPTAASGILRQILILGFGILFSGALRGYGEKVSRLLQQDNFTAMYGGVGIAAAVSVAELAVALLLFVLYKVNGGRRRVKQESGMRTTDSFMDCVRSLNGSRWSSFVTGLLAFLPLALGWLFFVKAVKEEDAASWQYGIYVGKYLAVCGIAFSLIMILALPVSGKSLGLLRKGEHRFSKSAFQSGLHLCVLHGIFAAMFLGVMGEQLSGLLYPDGNIAQKPDWIREISSLRDESDILFGMLRQGAALVLTAAVSAYLIRFLMGTGKKYLVMGALAVADVMFAVLTAAFLNLGRADAAALIYSGEMAGAVLCGILGVFAYRQQRLRVDWPRIFVVPVIAAGICGFISLLLRNLLAPHLGNLVTLIVTFVISSLVYWALLLLARDIREQELEVIPGGRLLNMLGQLLRVY